MKIAGVVVGLALTAGAYATWGVTWPAVLAVGLVGVVLSQVGHATGWREVFTMAGSACLFIALVGLLLLLFQLFMG